MVGMMLCAISGTWNLAVSAASVMSQTAAMAQPKPKARPRTTPITGISQRRKAPAQLERLGRRPGRAFTHRLAADAEVVAGPSQHHDLGGLGGTEQELGQLDGHGVRGGVPDLWSIERDFQDRPLAGGENVAGHAWSSQTLSGGAAAAR